MTADERIEALLNRFGQTISDLPERYSDARMSSAHGEAAKWTMRSSRVVRLSAEVEYICYLADVIDRMEAALETALNWMNCPACESFGRPNECKNCAETDNYRIADEFLHDIDPNEKLVVSLDVLEGME